MRQLDIKLTAHSDISKRSPITRCVFENPALMKVALQHAVTSLHSACRLSLQHLKNTFCAGVLEQLLSNLALGKQDRKLSLKFYCKAK